MEKEEEIRNKNARLILNKILGRQAQEEKKKEFKLIFEGPIQSRPGSGQIQHYSLNLKPQWNRGFPNPRDRQEQDRLHADPHQMLQKMQLNYFRRQYFYSSGAEFRFYAQSRDRILDFCQIPESQNSYPETPFYEIVAGNQ